MDSQRCGGAGYPQLTASRLKPKKLSPEKLSPKKAQKKTMSTTRVIHSCRVRLAGVFFIFFLLAMAMSFVDAPRAAAMDDRCLTGFPPAPQPAAEEMPYVLSSAQENPQLLIHPSVQQWVKDKSWRTGYSLWQQSRQCGSAFSPGYACLIKNAPIPSEGKCGGAIDGYQFLVMHRHLLQTFKTLWPELDKQFASGKKFPAVGDYPEEIQQQVYAWSNAVMRAAETVGTISKANSAEVLRRWPTEGTFGQWLQCGADKGIGADALYGALLSNAIDIPGDEAAAQPHLLDLYLFWRAHTWIDGAWEKYRRATGKMPDEPPLQAALIQQCRIHQFWSQQTAPTGTIRSSPKERLYKGGYLNPAYSGRLVRIQGEVEEMKTAENGRHYLRVNPRLVGVNTVWVSSDTLLDIGEISIGRRYRFIGQVTSSESFDPAGAPAEAAQNPALLLLQSMQSLK